LEDLERYYLNRITLTEKISIFKIYIAVSEIILEDNNLYLECGEWDLLCTKYILSTSVIDANFPKIEISEFFVVDNIQDRRRILNVVDRDKHLCIRDRCCFSTFETLLLFTMLFPKIGLESPKKTL